jgi:tRNA/tmRNA/rRNA uracil-C5-methylase (TrmA/RlmC/RlmD family)
MNIEAVIKFVDISPEGKAIGYYEGNKVEALGILPGEEAKVLIIKKKRKLEAKILEVIKTSEFMAIPLEDHFMSCSPFQIAEYDYQKKLKEQMLQKAYLEYAGIDIKIDRFYYPENLFKYRDKLEFSFHGIEKDLRIAFHKRGGKFYDMIDLGNGCALGMDIMNKAGLKILEWLNKNDFSEFDLKTLTLRASHLNNKVVAILLFKKELKIQKILDETGIPNLSEFGVDGIIAGFSSPKSPASNIDKIYFQLGIDSLVEEINGKLFKYPMDGFFQNNLELFPKAIDEMKEMIIGSELNGVELYSGVGTIGISLSEKFKKIIGVEIIESAVNYASQNAELNNVTNYTSIFSPSEKIDSTMLDNCDVLILDPARPGLHPKVIKMIKEKLPKQIIYLSCNPSTQAKDYKDIMDIYEIKRIIGFDFYPHTLHLESLIELRLKG